MKKQNTTKIITMNALSKAHFLLLLFLVTAGSVCGVLFTPALPEIKNFFKISVGDAQSLITIYLLGYAFAQLFYAPLANGLGRKKTLLVGLLIGIFGSILCILSSTFSSFHLLFLGRFIQAFGSAAGLKVSFTMIADLYNQKEAAQRISGFTIAFSVLPPIAVAIGGFLAHYLGWVSCFYFLIFFSILLGFFSNFLPESSKLIDRNSLKITSIINDYKMELKNKNLIFCSIIMGLTTAFVYTFAAKAPFIGISKMGLSPDQFGLLSLIPYTGNILGALFSIRYSPRYSPLNLIAFGIALSFMSCFLMLMSFLFGSINVFTLFFAMIAIGLPLSLIYSNSSSFGLNNSKNKSNASALMNFINITMCVLAVFISELIYPEESLMLPIIFYVFNFIMLFFWYKAKKLQISEVIFYDKLS